MARKTPAGKVDYDAIASSYDRRYAVGPPGGIAGALLGLAGHIAPRRILDAGCGTGHWMDALRSTGGRMYGLDISAGMLRRALERSPSLSLIRGEARRLPFRDRVFDLVYGVNALHHFDDPRGYLQESRRVLRDGGMGAVIGMDPHAGSHRWYLYDYFPGMRAADQKRYPGIGDVAAWMTAAGFRDVEHRTVAHLAQTRVGREVLEDPVLHRHGTSQLALLTDDAFAAGLARIESAFTAPPPGTHSGPSGAAATFTTDISYVMVTGRTA